MLAAPKSHFEMNPCRICLSLSMRNMFAIAGNGEKLKRANIGLPIRSVWKLGGLVDIGKGFAIFCFAPARYYLFDNSMLMALEHS
jgi:hypothetical protein